MNDHKQKMLDPLSQILQLVEKEDIHLQRVRKRLFGGVEVYEEK